MLFWWEEGVEEDGEDVGREAPAEVLEGAVSAEEGGVGRSGGACD